MAWATPFAFTFELHNRTDCLLMEGRHPLTALLLPDGAGNHLRRYLFAATRPILARLVRHEHRIFIESHIGKIRQAETGDGAVCSGHVFHDVVLAAVHHAAGDVN